MNFSTRVRNMAASALIACLMSFSLTCTLLGAVLPDYPWQTAALCCAAATALAALAALNRLTGALAALCAVGGGVALAVMRINPFAGLARAAEAVAALVAGGEADLRAELLTLTVFLALLFGVVSLMMVRLSGGVYPAALLFVFVLLGGWFLNRRVAQWPLVPGLIALAVLYARAFREQGSMLRALPAALLAAALAFALMPGSPVTWPPLQDAADKVRELFNDYFLFNDPRIVYSVSADGYQPRMDTLGGPATPRRADVMRVKTDEALLLRGTVSRTYTGRNWIDEAVNSRYLFLDPTRYGRRDSAFDVSLANRLADCLHRVRAEVTFLSEGTSTLFVPHRLISLSAPLDMPVYYNETGEVFITRGVRPGDSYAFEAWQPGADRALLAARVDAAAAANDPGFADARAGYMNLTAGIDADLYWLVMDLTADADTPFGKASAIRDYLTGGTFDYTIGARFPPEDRDFVSWFVLEEKRGYCTYFASAMAVMARLAGIPSRYAEGYRVEPNGGSSEVIVTGESAHAWAELYFNGVGWIAFDATPGLAGRSADDNPDDHRDTPPSAPETPEPSGAPGEPDATPEPSNAPEEPDATPEPSNAPGEPDATPEPSNAPDEPDATPEPSGAPDEPDASNPPDRPPRSLTRALLLLLLLLLAAAALLLARRRLIRNSPKYLAAREKDPRLRAMIWYHAVLKLLARSGLTPEGGESPEMFAARAVASGGVPDEMVALARRIAELQYARRAPDSAVCALGERVYGALLRRLSRRERFSDAAERLLHGPGDYTHIP